jgi:hypothetical protein
MRAENSNENKRACETRGFSAFCGWHRICGHIGNVTQFSKYMARKLYIFNPVGKLKADAQLPAKWVGGYSTDYSYLGDYQARMLGVGGYLSSKRVPQWLHAPTAGAKNLKGGASRSDRGFRGWG